MNTVKEKIHVHVIMDIHVFLKLLFFLKSSVFFWMAFPGRNFRLELREKSRNAYHFDQTRCKDVAANLDLPGSIR